MKRQLVSLLLAITLALCVQVSAQATVWQAVTPSPASAVETAPAPVSDFRPVEAAPMPVTTIAPTPAPATTPSLPAGAIGTVVVTNSQSARVRADSNQNSAQIGLINPGERYICMSIAPNGWCEIVYPTGITGYVSGKLVRFSEGGVAADTHSYVIGEIQITGGEWDGRMTNGPSQYSDYMGYADPGRIYPVVKVMANGWYAILREENGFITYVSPDAGIWMAGGTPATISAAKALLAQDDTYIVAPQVTPQIIEQSATTILAPNATLSTPQTNPSTSEDPVITVRLNGDREAIRTSETSLGNIAADSMRYVTGAQLALLNAGAFRASLEAGEVTKADTKAVFPYDNYIVMMNISGKTLLEALEHALTDLPGEGGNFPQISGMHVLYSESKPAGQSVLPYA